MCPAYQARPRRSGGHAGGGGLTRAEFLHKIGWLLCWCSANGIDVICFTFYRTPEQQKIEFDAGRSTLLHGKHQDWLAMDFALWDDIDADGNVDKDEIRWKNDPRYTEMGIYWESLGGTWGGRWESLNDIYHFEG